MGFLDLGRYWVRAFCLGWLCIAAQLSEGGTSNFTFAAITDTHIASATDVIRFRQFLFTIQRQHPDFVLILGDLCGHQPEYLPRIKSVMDHSGIPVYVIPGNHDDNYGNNAEWYQSVFGRMHETFLHKGWCFILNWSQSGETGWLKSRLTETPAGTPVVFCQHYPPQTTPPILAMLKDPLIAGNVRFALSGHTHQWKASTIGAISDFTLANAFFTGPAGNAHYYLLDVAADAAVHVRSFNMDDLTLENPPDAAPVVRIDSPVTGELLQGSAIVRGVASDDQSVARVELRVDGGEWRCANGTGDWSCLVTTTNLSDGHHLLECRAIDSAGQESTTYGETLCLVDNASPVPGVLRFQEGCRNYTGCVTATARRQGGSTSDLECWIWGDGEEEFCEFYMAYDLSKVVIPANAAISRASLTLYGTRQNFQSLKGKPANFSVSALGQRWSEAGPFETRPGQPGRLTPRTPGIELSAWPSFGGMQMVMPPKAVVIDLTSMTNVINQWLEDPAKNYGLVVSPVPGANYNFSAAAARNPIKTLRPVLELEWRPREAGRLAPVVAPTNPVAYKTLENIPYRTGGTLDATMRDRCCLDLYYPATSTGFVTVVWFHGGGMISGSKSIPEKLKNRGYAVVAPNYRLSSMAKCPAYIEDAAAATAWVFRNIAGYGGATNKIVVAGYSAGGYLTSMIGLDKRWLAPYGLDPTGIAMLVPFSGQAITHYTIRDERGIPETQPVVDEYAPLWHVHSNAPPLHLITGDRELEGQGRYEENAYFCRMMKVAGHKDTHLYELGGFDHGSMAAPAFELFLKLLKQKFTF